MPELFAFLTTIFTECKIINSDNCHQNRLIVGGIGAVFLVLGFLMVVPGFITVYLRNDLMENGKRYTAAVGYDGICPYCGSRH